MNDELEFFQGLCVFLAVVSGWATIAWLRARDRVRAWEDRQRKVDLAEADADLRRAVESIAIEVERLGEGQRFLTRVLGDQASAKGTPVVLPTPRVVTPH